ncbi:transposase [Sphingomonas sp. MG17]|uniref:Transposase n=1 Tax=Sphingomonas tagetis TaxID=2949092 RepID=A0A9X2KML7_9SPHN|nr:transposase [Sphingomonas tagetis]MCP3731606.1 transposase [Sphingomonas tagetis]
MPRLIDPGTDEAISLDELTDALDACSFDPHDEDEFAALGPLLARLGRNRMFLADLALAELKARCANQSAANGYGPQVFLLAPPNGRYVVRANFWPALTDPVVQVSGTAPFFYDLPHDHNFPFLTYGYLGPGYWSDYYEYDGAGEVGEPAGLRFVERSRLDPGKLMLYRMQRDVHVQLPPDSFSVSLNILGQHPSHPWIDQYRFDIRRGVIAEALTMAPSEALATLAAHLGGEAGRELVEHLAVSHAHPRMRATALAARLSAGAAVDATATLERAAADAAALPRSLARQALARLAS